MKALAEAPAPPKPVAFHFTQTDSFVNQTSVTGELETGPLRHSFNAGVEYSSEKTVRGTYAIAEVRRPNGQTTAGTNNPLTGNQSCPTTGAATGYNCTDLTNPNPNDPWSATHTVTRSDPARDVRCSSSASRPETAPSTQSSVGACPVTVATKISWSRESSELGCTALTVAVRGIAEEGRVAERLNRADPAAAFHVAHVPVPVRADAFDRR